MTNNILKNLPLLLSGVFTAATAQLFLKKGMLIIGSVELTGASVINMILNAMQNFWIWTGVIFYALSMLIWMIVLSRVEVSTAYPFTSLGYILTTIFAWQLLGEIPSIQKIAGISIICLGVAILGK